MKRVIGAFLALLLAGLLCVSVFAADAELHVPKQAVAGKSLQALLTEFMDDHRLTEDNFSLCYYNTVTQEEYRFNETHMMVAASTYKLPLNLYYYELEEAGEVSSENSYYLNTSLANCHYQSLVWSNNELSQAMLYALGNFHTYKDCMRKYFTMTDEEIDPSYYAGNNYCTRMMMDTLQYIYANSERFPELLDYIKQAMPGEYFKKYVTDVEIAHKYGCYEGAENDVGIFYTEQPFLLAVYTQDVGVEVVSEAAALLRTYNECKLDADRAAEEQARQQRLVQRQAAEQAALRRAEDRAAREELRKQRELAEAAEAARLQTENAQEKAAEAATPEAVEPSSAEPAAQTGSGQKNALVWWVPVVALAIFGVGALLLSSRAKHHFSLIDELDREDAESEEEAADAPQQEADTETEPENETEAEAETETEADTETGAENEPVL